MGIATVCGCDLTEVGCKDLNKLNIVSETHHYKPFLTGC